MFKQNRLTIEEAQKGLSIFNSIPLRYIEPGFVNDHFRSLAFFLIKNQPNPLNTLNQSGFVIWWNIKISNI